MVTAPAVFLDRNLALPLAITNMAADGEFAAKVCRIMMPARALSDVWSRLFTQATISASPVSVR
jgi:hypothetical protein